MTQLEADTATELLGIDHLALRVLDPDAMARFLCDHCGMQRADSDEGFTVLAPAGGRTRLVLVQAEQAPNPGLLQRVILRVSGSGTTSWPPASSTSST